MKHPLLLFQTSCLLYLAGIARAESRAVVVAPVADLRSDRSAPPHGLSDDKQQTQLLFGEPVTVIASSGPWVQINALEQPEYSTNQRWEGYPGWIPTVSLKSVEKQPDLDGVVVQKWLPVRAEKKSEPFLRLPMGSRVKIRSNSGAWRRIDLLNGQTGWVPKDGVDKVKRIPPAKLRDAIIQTAEGLLGVGYTWGGLTPTDDAKVAWLSGLDCSGLVHLSYRINGLTIPRDSIEQYWKSEKIRRADLKPGDLIFSAKKETPKKISHVTLYRDPEQIIEAPQTGMVVRQVSFKEKYGKDLAEVDSGDTVGDRVVYFGRLIKD